MPFFTRQGHDCYAVSLRGTAATGMPPGDPGETVRVDQHVSDLSFCLDTILKRGREEGQQVPLPVAVGHSLGGLTLLKLLESRGLRNKLSGVTLLYSVPPSGNGHMTGRFLRRDLCKALSIVWGFVFKGATSSLANARALFFDQTVPDSDIEL